MTKFKVIAGLALALGACTAAAAQMKVPMSAINETGVGQSIGDITIAETSSVLEFTINVTGIPDGEHGFHVHEKGDCGPGEKDGKPAAGLAAGGHFDPASTKTHKGPDHAGHQGDLPKLTSSGGKISTTVKVANTKLADVAGRALMIHEGGDNYSDNPENGGGKARIACGVVPAK